MNRKFLALIIFFLTAAQASDAQKYVAQKSSVGLTAGALSYAGRYSVGASLMSHTSYNASLFYSYNVMPKNLLVRGEVMFGQLKGDNTKLQSLNGATQGSFSTNIFEVTAKGEYDFLDLRVRKASPYVFAGGGFYTLNNYSSTSGAKIENKNGFVLPVGGGVKYKASERIKILLEGNVRFFPKNLDNVTNVTTNANNPNKYYSVNLGVSYYLQKAQQLW